MEHGNRFLADYSSEMLNDIVFWSRGNHPTQQIHRLTLAGLRRDFAVTYLLANQMFLAASFFFESELTRKITRQYEPVFSRGEALYFIDENLDSFTEHGRRKREKSPSGMYGYQDAEQIREYGHYLDQLGFVLRRAPKKISIEMRRSWISDVNNISSQSLGALIQKEVGLERDEPVRMALSEIAVNSANQEIDFVWPYIQLQLNEKHVILPDSLEETLKTRLSDLYCTTTAASILKTPLDSHIGGTRRFDPKLFWRYMHAGQVTDYFDRLSVPDLIALKHSDIFRSFRSYYLGVIDLIESCVSIPVYDEIDLKNPYRLLEFLSQTTGQNYRQPISQLKGMCDHFCSSVEHLGLLNHAEWHQLFYRDVLAPNLKIAGGSKNMFGRILVYTALKSEMDAILRHYPEVKPFDSDGTFKTTIVNLYAGYETEVLFFSSNAMGSTVSAADCSRLIERYRPDSIVLVGITAGFDQSFPDFDFGDLLIGEQIVGYELAKVKDEDMNRRFDVYRGSYSLIRAVHDADEAWERKIIIPRPDGNPRIKPAIHSGVILSGNKVVASHDFKVTLGQSWSKAIGMEMESWGVAVAAYRSSRDIPFLCLKSICDWGEADKNDVWQSYCAAVAADFLATLLPRIKLDQFPSVKLSPPAQDRPAAPTDPAEPEIPVQNEPAAPASPAAPEQAARKIGGKIAYALNEALGDNWEDIARILEIPVADMRKFAKGREIYSIIDYVNSTQKVNEFMEALNVIHRSDCVERITAHWKGENT